MIDSFYKIYSRKGIFMKKITRGEVVSLILCIIGTVFSLFNFALVVIMWLLSYGVSALFGNGSSPEFFDQLRMVMDLKIADGFSLSLFPFMVAMPVIAVVSLIVFILLRGKRKRSNSSILEQKDKGGNV